MIPDDIDFICKFRCGILSPIWVDTLRLKQYIGYSDNRGRGADIAKYIPHTCWKEEVRKVVISFVPVDTR